MERNQTAYRGCLLGLAVGDAMGYAVDSLTWQEIQAKYGSNGLMGYELVNGYADVTSHTQLAAFTCNGLLIALTQGQMTGRMLPPVKYAGLAGREWVASQRPWGRPDKTFCWLMQQPEICRRRCMETRMLDSLSRDNLGSMEDPRNSFAQPGALTSAVAAGLFYRKGWMRQLETDRLGAEIVALSHGSPLAFLSGAVIAHMVSTSLYFPKLPFKRLVQDSMRAVSTQFGHQYSQCYELSHLLNTAIGMAEAPGLVPASAMEQLHCENSAQVLAGAVYACMASRENFDNALIIAVNHSGRSAAVGALTGALLGLRQKEEALPVFYMQCLEPTELLMELADDLFYGCPMEKGTGLFDVEWDRKYVHGGK